MKIELTNGYSAIIDGGDHDIAMNHKWFGMVKGGVVYVAANMSINGRQKRIYLHQAVMGFPGKEIDHINGNGLDNRRSNLRICTSAENKRNRPKQSNNKSGYKGVYWHKQRKKWAAAIRHNGRQISLGLHEDPKIAHEAYLSKAEELWGKDDLARVKNEQKS